MRLAALIAATLVLAGCGGAEPAASPSQPEPPPTIRLPVLVDEQATSWEIDVPVADGWEPVVEAGQPIAAITRPWPRLWLLLQVAAGVLRPSPTRRGSAACATSRTAAARWPPVMSASISGTRSERRSAWSSPAARRARRAPLRRTRADQLGAVADTDGTGGHGGTRLPDAIGRLRAGNRRRRVTADRERRLGAVYRVDVDGRRCEPRGTPRRRRRIALTIVALVLNGIVIALIGAPSRCATCCCSSPSDSCRRCSSRSRATRRRSVASRPHRGGVRRAGGASHLSDRFLPAALCLLVAALGTRSPLFAQSRARAVEEARTRPVRPRPPARTPSTPRCGTPSRAAARPAPGSRAGRTSDTAAGSRVRCYAAHPSSARTCRRTAGRSDSMSPSPASSTPSRRPSSAATTSRTSRSGVGERWSTCSPNARRPAPLPVHVERSRRAEQLDLQAVERDGDLALVGHLPDEPVGELLGPGRRDRSRVAEPLDDLARSAPTSLRRRPPQRRDAGCPPSWRSATSSRRARPRPRPRRGDGSPRRRPRARRSATVAAMIASRTRCEDSARVTGQDRNEYVRTCQSSTLVLDSGEACPRRAAIAARSSARPVGRWLYHCHVFTHQDAGMAGWYVVDP